MYSPQSQSTLTSHLPCPPIPFHICILRQFQNPPGSHTISTPLSKAPTAKPLQLSCSLPNPASTPCTCPFYWAGPFLLMSVYVYSAIPPLPILSLRSPLPSPPSLPQWTCTFSLRFNSCILLCPSEPLHVHLKLGLSQ